MRDTVESICESLAELGVYTAVIEYDGSGDSGDIIDSRFLDDNGKEVEVPNRTVARVLSYVEEHTQDVDYNNDGGGGTATIYVDRVAATFENYYYETSRQYCDVYSDPGDFDLNNPREPENEEYDE